MPSAPTQSWRRAVLAADLPTSTKVVALVLSVYVNAMGEGWPSRASLAEGAGVSVRTVDRAIARLEQAGLVVVTRYVGRTRTNRFRVVLPAEKGDILTPFPGLRALGITLGITPEKATLATIKGDTGVARTSKELEDLSRGRPRTYARTRPRESPSSERGEA